MALLPDLETGAYYRTPAIADEELKKRPYVWEHEMYQAFVDWYLGDSFGDRTNMIEEGMRTRTKKFVHDSFHRASGYKFIDVKDAGVSKRAITYDAKEEYVKKLLQDEGMEFVEHTCPPKSVA